jgi:hypothetical protein
MAIAIEEALKGKTILWGAPVYDISRIGWEESLHALGRVGQKNVARMEIVIPDAGRIVFRSLDDPDNARGHTADGVVIDEAPYCKEESWHEAIRPMLIDTGGWAWLIGSPNGHNWFWRDFVRAQDDPNSIAWRAPTKGYRIEKGQLVRVPHPLENPDISADEIEHLFTTMPEATFRQEILGEFTEHEGQVFRNILANLYVPNGDVHEGHRRIMGLDWGQRNDYTVASIGCADCQREIAVDRFTGVDYPTQRDRIMVLYERYHPEVLAEANSMGLPNIQQLREDGIPVLEFDTTHTSKTFIVREMQLALERETWKWIDDATGREQFEAYEMHVTTQGNVTYSAPAGMHDDVVVARAIMLYQASLGGVSFA